MLLTLQPLVWFLAFLRTYFVVSEIHQRCWLEDSGQMPDSVDWTHLIQIYDKMLKLPIIFVQLVFKSKIEFWAELANLFQLDYNSFFLLFLSINPSSQYSRDSKIWLIQKNCYFLSFDIQNSIENLWRNHFWKKYKFELSKVVWWLVL